MSDKVKYDRTAYVSRERMKRAAKALSRRWLTAFDLASEVMRASIRVRGNRIIKRMEKMGLVISRPTGRIIGSYPETEYRLSPEGEEMFGCRDR